MPLSPPRAIVDERNLDVYGALTAPVAVGAGTTVVKSSPGRLCTVIVTTAATTGVKTIYDNASGGSGTVVAVIPANAAAGTIYQLQVPCQNGITVVGAASDAGITIVYS